MASHSLTSLFAGLRLSRPTPQVMAPFTATTTTSLLLNARPLSTTPCVLASKAAKNAAAKTSKPGQKRKKNKAEEPDARIRNLKISMPRKAPAPLRFARNRHLRHWTIHRAWLLWQRKEREREEKELMRMYQSMASASEELRHTSGPGTRDEGYLYRVSMEKKGLFGHNAIPIEYARPQTETPARIAWNHEWKR
ncbi:hypothetical protein TruAng_008850 [Truncatella angustata]|nr:hypothetical protein TruAng_008850 [Truncatella angustata]